MEKKMLATCLPDLIFLSKKMREDEIRPYFTFVKCGYLVYREIY